MNLMLLIDGIVRQTTVLLAQLSTSSGARAPLAHVADQIFVDLAREIESQGVRRQVVADMFGMALRSYQKKVQRLTASATEPQRTLWQAVLELVEREQPRRSRVFERFERDGQREVAAVLADLVRSGLIYMSGTGEQVVYGPTSDSVRERVQGDQDHEALANVLWLHAFRSGSLSRQELAELTQAPAAAVDAAIEDLVASARLVREADGCLTSANFVLPLGAEQGWEAAILHHFTTVAVAIAAKVRAGGGSNADDRIGGSTFTFELSPGHPFEQRVYALLQRTRAEAQQLWEELSAHNATRPADPKSKFKVSFYVGQTLEQTAEEAP